MKINVRPAVVYSFVALIAISFSMSCARMEKRAPRYDATVCPFCTMKSGVCSYCEGSTKCSFCKGAGKRTTVAPAVPEEGVKGGAYTESCPYCKGKGVCQYCEGSAKCWACKGTAKAGDWNFYERYKEMSGAAQEKLIQAVKDSVATANTPAPAPAKK